MGFTTVSNLKDRKLVRSDDRDIIGIHTMEAPEGSQTAEVVANYFKRVLADSHWCVDDNSRVRVIPDWAIAWTLPGANSRSLNLEFAGYARQTREDWFDEFSLNMLEIGAYCAAEWVIKYDIPIRRLTDAQIRAGEKGFAGHVDVNRVYHQSSHWDPGPAFPWPYFLDRVRVAVGLIKNQPVDNLEPEPVKPNWNNRGYSMAWIKAQQEKLTELGFELVADGKLGPITMQYVASFQKLVGLTADGIPGPATSAALDKALATKSETPVRKPNCKPLQRAVRVHDDNVWGLATDKALLAVRESSVWGGNSFPYGVRFTQAVVGTHVDGIWGDRSRAAHDATVVAVQTALKSMGFNPGRVDGRWGRMTDEAFQSARKACRI